ncbi:hypothetical protein GQ457_18G003160 [Hibiscus cannabinus]
MMLIPRHDNLCLPPGSSATTPTSEFRVPVLDNNPFRPGITLDLNLSCSNRENSSTDVKYKEKRIEEYVASLAKDPNFTVALAADVARSMAEQPKPPTP